MIPPIGTESDVGVTGAAEMDTTLQPALVLTARIASPAAIVRLAEPGIRSVVEL